MTKPTEKLFETKADEQIFDLKGFLRELEGDMFQKEQRYMHRYSANTKMQQYIQQLVLAAHEAAIRRCRELEGTIKEAETKRAAKRKKSEAGRTPRRQGRSRGEDAAVGAAVH
ncbi:MAG: hypothetical protein WAN43_09450 [Rhodomicrobium sp.]|jgi:hypothetical protein